jgi:DNA-binding transcriptional ArsR family regulator
MLAAEDRTVNEIADAFEITRTAVSKHLRVLRDTGFVNERKEGRQHYQCFNGDALKPVADWVRTYEGFWDTRLAALKQLIESEESL